MKYKSDLSLNNFNHIQRAWYANEIADVKDIQNLLSSFKNISPELYRVLPFFFIIDYTAREYLLVTETSKAVSSYHAQEFLESGLDAMMGIMNKDDYAIFRKKVFASNSAFLASTSYEDHDKYIFNYNFRFIRHDKKMGTLLQRSSYLTSKATGLPLYSLGTITDITNVKTDTSIVQTIEKIDPDFIYETSIVEKNFYYPNEEDGVLSRREKTVLEYMSDGLSSKQVADKLNISENTVHNHRQNMLRKTNTKNVAELVTFAIRNRII